MKLIIDFFLVGGILMTLLIIFLLFKQKKRELPQNILLFFFGIIFFYILNAYADFNDLDILNYLTFIFADVIAILVGPIIYMYIKAIFIKKYKFTDYWIHLIPSFFYLILVSIPILVSSILRRFVFDYLAFANNYNDLFFFVFTLYMLFYFSISLLQFKKYKKAFKDNFSNLTDGDFRWIYHLLLGLLFIGFVDLLITILEFSSYEMVIDSNLILLLPVTLLILYLGYNGIAQQRILLPNFLIEEPVQKPIKKSNKKRTSIFTESELRDIEKKMKLLFEEDKPYLDENVTLQKLAEGLSITDKKLSTFLNQYLNTFLKALFTPNVLLNQQTIDKMITITSLPFLNKDEFIYGIDNKVNRVEGIGLGIFKLNTDYGFGYGHNGGYIGRAARMWYFPDDKKSIVFMINATGTSIKNITREIFRNEMLALLFED